MRSALFLLSVSVVVVLAFWAYRENHNTRQAMAERSALTREIAALEEAISVQRAEWAYLNRPARLNELVLLNFDRLLLLPMEAAHFGTIDQVAYPLPEPAPVDLDLMGEGIEVFGAYESEADEHREQEP